MAATAVDGIVPEQVGEVRELEQVVDRDHLHVGALHRRAERHPADAPEPVDADLDHVQPPIVLSLQITWTPPGGKDNDIAFSASGVRIDPWVERRSGSGFSSCPARACWTSPGRGRCSATPTMSSAAPPISWRRSAR